MRIKERVEFDELKAQVEAFDERFTQLEDEVKLLKRVWDRFRARKHIPIAMERDIPFIPRPKPLVLYGYGHEMRKAKTDG